MKIDKNDVLKALKSIFIPGEEKNIVESKAVLNVMTFRDQIDVDLKLENPTLQARKKLEVNIPKTIHEQVYEKAKIKVNFKIVQSNKSNDIIVRFYCWHSKYHCYIIWKGWCWQINCNSEYCCNVKKMGCKVGVLDADIYGPSIPTMFDLGWCEPPLFHRLKVNLKWKPIENYGVKVLSIGFLLNLIKP